MVRRCARVPFYTMLPAPVRNVASLQVRVKVILQRARPADSCVPADQLLTRPLTVYQPSNVFKIYIAHK